MKTIIAICCTATGMLMTALAIAIAGTVAVSVLVAAGAFIALLWILGIVIVLKDFFADVSSDVLKDKT